jgi:IS5 family transposase
LSYQKSHQEGYADKGYFGENNRDFLNLNKTADGIMRKAAKGMELTPYEKERNKAHGNIRIGNNIMDEKMLILGHKPCLAKIRTSYFL